MEIIRAPLCEWNASLPAVRLLVERRTLAKRRWRGMADDGADFGFDLETPLADGAHVLQTANARYLIAQKYELVLELRIIDGGWQMATAAARLGWMIGNLHFQIEIVAEAIRVPDDPALRQLFARERIPFVACKRVFHPLTGGHQH